MVNRNYQYSLTNELVKLGIRFDFNDSQSVCCSRSFRTYSFLFFLSVHILRSQGVI